MERIEIREIKVKELLKNFYGMNHIKIFNKYNVYRYNSVKKAVNDCGCFTVKQWTIESNTLVIITV